MNTASYERGMDLGNCVLNYIFVRHTQMTPLSETQMHWYMLTDLQANISMGFTGLFLRLR